GESAAVGADLRGEAQRLRFAAHGQVAGDLVAVPGLLDLGRYELRLRIGFDAEEVGRLEMVGQLGVVGVQRGHVDFDGDLERGGVVVLNGGGTGELLEAAVVFAAGLGADKGDGGVFGGEREVVGPERTGEGRES